MKNHLPPTTYHLQTRRGFTLIEILIVLAIIGVLVAPLTLYLFGFRTEQSLSLDGRVLSGVLQDARQKSIFQEQDSRWSVRFDSDGGWYDLFQGTDYALAPLRMRYRLSSSIRFTAPSSGMVLDVSFETISGCLLSGGSCSGSQETIVIVSNTGQRTITVFPNGRVDVQ
ncbi:MAG: hypothetical protein COU08_01285 [Candidatus Harrisonbacteria bacterium CG10_big_fil_rev_8_21_14_0_10_42_17]|uniref:General secretion pathway GspH domain-containing protein n=1 Tax=Candidatus Harrisonbacteria bacterium CG10_big_fil_rev_8_21_14_0_10_42_17 TaxID=1974584 RepID=A0A2M6WIJ3_9BACT|nr:MAG: hypothetical protein COU08_01285 [Candidatus Harrisonbacteria bacterium CG10_big_fil_rev_8_21_14_0_10_42_17]